MTDSLKNAYNEPSSDAERGERRRQRELAASYRFDARLEELARQLEQDPDRPISPTLRMSLGFYKSAQQAAQAEGKR